MYHVGENKRHEAKKLHQFVSTIIVGLIVVQSGINLAWSSPVLPYLKSENPLVSNITADQESWVSSLMALGAVVGAAPAGMIADTIGRKFAMIFTAVPFLISWMTLIFGTNVNAIYGARVIGGIGAGAAGVLVPVYIGEIAEPQIRGALGSFFPIFFTLGILFAYVFGAVFEYVKFNAACCLALIPFIPLSFMLPESPMWLVHKGKIEVARKSLKTLRGESYNIEDEIATLAEEARQLEFKKGGLHDLVRTKAGRKAIITCVGLMWFQQMCGIDAVLFYTVTIFEDAGSTVDAFLSTVIIGFVEVVMAVVAGFTIDRYGRKPLLILSGTGMFICLGVLGYYFRLKESGNDVVSIGWLPLLSLSLYNIVFSVGYGAVPYSVISELFPPETKGIASGISVMTNWFLVFTVTKLFPKMAVTLGQSVTFWIFGSICGVSAVFACLIPETKGKTLQEIQAKLGRKSATKMTTISS